ncbi:hypothetical protein [Blastopirellula marina]|uniref:hypothetical protein n=1 Tax=Blastopirellula marina TaxID=124 RepID=UPI0011B05D74|nr:hypothetical protein [Blastopirellula marina]
MESSNPFQTPQHIEEEDSSDAAPLDPTRPKPLSILSILALACVIFVVVGSLNLSIFHFVHRGEEGYETGETISQVLNAVLVMCQTLLVGFWVAVGRGHALMRVIVGGILFTGLAGQLAMNPVGAVSEMILAALLLFSGAIGVTAFLDAILLAARWEGDLRRAGVSAMKAILAASLGVGLIVAIHWAPLSFLELIQVSRVGSLLGDLGSYSLFGSVCAVGGIFLLLRKHGIRLRWGIGMFLLTPLLIAAINLIWSQVPWMAIDALTFAAVAQVACLMFFHAVDRVLRSFGGSLVPLPRTEAPKPTADD